MTAIHPVVHKELRLRAAEEDRTIQEALHVILCSEFGLSIPFNDLIPEHASSPQPA